MSELSPAAQAVLDAYGESNDCYREEWGQVASALRVVATALGAEEILRTESKCTEGVKLCVQRIYAIADELEAQ